MRRNLASNTHPPTLRKSTEGHTIAVVGDLYRFLATGDETDGKYAMFEAIVPPGGGPPPHIHSREEESFLFLEGEITFTIGDEQIVATVGTFANMPVGSLHSFKNATDKILHSRADDVVPFDDSEQLARNSGAKLVEVGNNHRLADPEPLAAMLRACGVGSIGVGK